VRNQYDLGYAGYLLYGGDCKRQLIAFFPDRELHRTNWIEIQWCAVWVTWVNECDAEEPSVLRHGSAENLTVSVIE
jgi:hypothetical protein